MRATATAVVILLTVLAAPAQAIPTVSITGGFLFSQDITNDIRFDLQGDGFEIGPESANTGYGYFVPVNALNGPCCGRAAWGLRESFLGLDDERTLLTFIHTDSRAGLAINESRTVPFTLTGVIGTLVVGRQPDPFVADFDVTGQGWFTVTLLPDNDIGTAPGFFYLYTFTAPEPRMLALLGVGLILLAGSTYLARGMSRG
jgi:hypothetical protein